MPDVEPLMRILREQAGRVVGRCHDALHAGVPIARVQGYYFDRLHALVDEAEAQALLALGGSGDAVTAIEQCIDALNQLADELKEEMAQAAGEEPDR